MAGLFRAITWLFTGDSGGGQQQQWQPLPPQPAPPTIADPSVQAAALATQTSAANARGRASTIMTGGQGDTSDVTTLKKQLLGGG